MALFPGEDLDLEEGDAAETAANTRRKLGIPEYDPNASLLHTLPKITNLCWKFDGVCFVAKGLLNVCPSQDRPRQADQEDRRPSG